MSVKAILERYTKLKVDLASLSTKFSEHVLDYNGKLRRPCPSCGRPLRTYKSKLCKKCNMQNVGKRHLETRKKKGFS
ncbi:MAG: hypothetical protein ABR909_08535 [Candidatus Bathyarchaeia archaeon]|jgi:hypothetical protein